MVRDGKEPGATLVRVTMGPPILDICSTADPQLLRGGGIDVTCDPAKIRRHSRSIDFWPG